MAYQGGFVDHYIMPVLYPDGLTRNAQIALGGLILAINLTVYCIAFARRWKLPGLPPPAINKD